MFNDISCDRKDNKDECLKNAEFVTTFAKKIWNWSMVFHWTRFWEKVVSFRKQPTRCLGPCCGRYVTKIRRKWTSPSSVQRLHCPEENWKVKEKGKCPYTSVPNQIQLIQFIALFLSVNQLSIYGAVAAICDEYESHPDSTGEPVILEGQSIVLREVKAEAPARWRT